LGGQGGWKSLQKKIMAEMMAARPGASHVPESKNSPW
jgi:hypothetical protein